MKTPFTAFALSLLLPACNQGIVKNADGTLTIDGYVRKDVSPW